MKTKQMEMINMIGKLTLLTTLGFFVHSAVAMPLAGQTGCSVDRSGKKCHFSWNLAATPNNIYVIQKFKPRKNDWKDVSFATDPYSHSDSNLEEGFLYRVLACSSKKDRDNCTSSTVYWVPVIPDSVDEIPDVVADPHGGLDMNIAKNLEIVAQTLQLNGYLLRNAMTYAGVGASSLPEMSNPSEPVFSQNPEMQVIASIEKQAFRQYNSMR